MLRRLRAALRPPPHRYGGLAPFDATAPFVPGSPTATVANTDVPLTFSRQARSVAVQNNSAAVIYIAFDAPAGLGTWAVAAGSTAFFDVPCSVLHIYATAVLSINGTTAGQIVAAGWL